jgi:hypothetical protein
MSIFEEMMKQYESSHNGKRDSGSQKTYDLKNYFNTILPKGVDSETKRIRILPPTEGIKTPFTTMWGHVKKVNGEWKTFPCPKHEKGEDCPFCQAREALLATGKDEDKELAKQYSARQFYVVKVIDRDRENEGVKFWRFKHNYKKQGVFDKIMAAIVAVNHDVTDIENGRDLNVVIVRDGQSSVVQSVSYPLETSLLSSNGEKVKESYAGGYIKEPNIGLYFDVIDLDFTSLYPSIIRNLNMGIETLIGRIQNSHKYDNQWGLGDLKKMDGDEEIPIEKVTQDRRVKLTYIKVKDMIQLVETNKLIISANGTLFRKDKSSIVVEILNDWFNKRKQYKDLMKQAYKAGDTAKGEHYNRLQHTFKIKLNDVYGVFAINSWRYSDGNLFISKAITLTGQRLVVESAKFVNEEINKELGLI